MKELMGKEAQSSWDDPDVQAMLTLAGEALTDADDGRRRFNVRRLLESTPPFLVNAVVDHLVALLAGRKDAVREGGARSLAEIGPPAAPALARALVRGRSSRRRRAAAGALTAMLPRLSPDQQTDLSYLALGAGMRTRDDAVRRALSRLVAAVRRAKEPGDGPYEDIAYGLVQRFGRSSNAPAACGSGAGPLGEGCTAGGHRLVRGETMQSARPGSGRCKVGRSSGTGQGRGANAATPDRSLPVRALSKALAEVDRLTTLVIGIELTAPGRAVALGLPRERWIVR